MTRPLAYDPCDCCGCTPCPGDIPWDCPACEIGTAELDLSGWSIPSQSWTESVLFFDYEFEIFEFNRLKDRICVGTGQTFVVAEFVIRARRRSNIFGSTGPWVEFEVPVQVLAAGVPGTWSIHAPLLDFFPAGFNWQTSAIHLWHPATDPLDYSACVSQTVVIQASTDTLPPPAGTGDPSPVLVDAGQVAVIPKCCDPACVVPVDCPGCRTDDPQACCCGGLPKTAQITWSMDACEWCHRRLTFDGPDVVRAEYWRLTWLTNPSGTSCEDVVEGDTISLGSPSALQIEYLDLANPATPPPDCATAFAQNPATAVETGDLIFDVQINNPSAWGRVSIDIDLAPLNLIPPSGDPRLVFSGATTVGCAAVRDLTPLSIPFAPSGPNSLGHANATTCPGSGDYTAPAEPDVVFAAGMQLDIDWCCGTQTDCEPPPCLTSATFTPPCPSLGGTGWVRQDLLVLFFPNQVDVWNCDNNLEAYIYDPVTNLIIRIFSDITAPDGIGIETIQEPC